VIVVDASVWVAILVANDAHQVPSLASHRRRIGEELRAIAPVLLSIELAGVVSRLTANPLEAYRAVRFRRRTPFVDLVALDRRREVQGVRSAADLGLRGADATYVGLAVDEEIPLVTWDTQQIARRARYVTFYTPLTYPW
jgi:predicted nucleic acid-binding protein